MKWIPMKRPKPPTLWDIIEFASRPINPGLKPFAEFRSKQRGKRLKK